MEGPDPRPFGLKGALNTCGAKAENPALGAPQRNRRQADARRQEPSSKAQARGVASLPDSREEGTRLHRLGPYQPQQECWVGGLGELPPNAFEETENECLPRMLEKTEHPQGEKREWLAPFLNGDTRGIGNQYHTSMEASGNWPERPEQRLQKSMHQMQQCVSSIDKNGEYLERRGAEELRSECEDHSRGPRKGSRLATPPWRELVPEERFQAEELQERFRERELLEEELRGQEERREVGQQRLLAPLRQNDVSVVSQLPRQLSAQAQHLQLPDSQDLVQQGIDKSQKEGVQCRPFPGGANRQGELPLRVRWGTQVNLPKHHMDEDTVKPREAEWVSAQPEGYGCRSNVNLIASRFAISSDPEKRTTQKAYRARIAGCVPRIAHDEQQEHFGKNDNASSLLWSPRSIPRTPYRLSKGDRPNQHRATAVQWEGDCHRSAPKEPSHEGLCIQQYQRALHGRPVSNVPGLELAATPIGNRREQSSQRQHVASQLPFPSSCVSALVSHQAASAALAEAAPPSCGPHEDRPLRDWAPRDHEVGEAPSRVQSERPPQRSRHPQSGTVLKPKDTTEKTQIWPHNQQSMGDVGKQGGPCEYCKLWWRRVIQRNKGQVTTAATKAALLAGVELTMGSRKILALLDTGATHSFAAPKLVEALQLTTTPMDEAIEMVVASGETFTVKEKIKKACFQVAKLYTSAELLIAPIPYDIILGADWLHQLKAIWDFGKNRLTAFYKNWKFTVPVLEVALGELGLQQEQGDESDQRRIAQAAHAHLVDSVNQLGSGAAALVRKQQKRYKNFKTKHKRVPIKEILNSLRTKMEEGLHEHGQCNLLAATSGQEGQTTKQTLDIQAPARGYELDQAQNSKACLAYSKVETWLGEAKKEGRDPRVVSIIERHKALFPDELPDGLPPQREIDMTIITVPGATVPKGGTPRCTPQEIEALRQILQTYLRKKWIQRSSSPYAAPVMLVPKKGDPPGSPGSRMVINYRPLNAVTIVGEVPLPVIEDVLVCLQGAQWFTTMDMEQGFHQVRMAPCDMHKTAFRTFMGQFEWSVMPFGLKGAPGTFQSIMNSIFFDFIGKGVLVYMDDVLVYTKTFDEHMALLEKVLFRLWEHKMYPKLSKCKFAVQAIEYLGFHVGADGIRPSPEKVSAIEAWPTELANDTQVRQFLGTVNYCRNFMGPEFAVLAKPLQQLIKKGVDFVWTEEHTAAVKALKQRLVNYTTLSLPDLSKPFVLRTDASGQAIGAVLEQDGRPIGFLSQKLTEAEMRYSTYEQELLAIIKALEKWRQLLITSETIVYTDHQALQYLTKLNADKPIRGKIARWLSFLDLFQKLNIQYQPGATNVVADALSRCPLHSGLSSNSPITVGSSSPTSGAATQLGPTSDNQASPSLPPNASLNLIVPLFMARARKAIKLPGRVVPLGEGDAPDGSGSKRSAEEEEEIKNNKPALGSPLMQGVGDEVWEEALQKCTEFGYAYSVAKELEPHHVLIDGVGKFKLVDRVLCIQLQGLWRICVPNFPTFKQRILYLHHDIPTAGHLGISKTYSQLSQRFYWKGMREYTRLYVETCPRCRASKAISQKPAGLLQPLEIPSRRWATISLDFIVGLPISDEGYDSILSVVDSLSKMAHFIPTTSTISALQFTELFVDRIVRYHGLPTTIVSDRDPKFVSEFWKVFCQKFSIKRALSTAWHPQTDGQTERINRTIEQMMRTYIQSREEEWPSLLPALELAYNCTPHSATGHSPFEIMIGENPLRTQDLDVVDTFPPIPTPQMTKAFRLLVDRAAAHLQHAKAQQKMYADEHRRPVEFAEGDKVWVSTRYLVLGGNRKFQQKYIGPYRVLEKIGKAAYRVDLPPSMTIHPVFHVSLLIPDKERPQDMMGPSEWLPIEEAPDGTPIYEVEHILAQQGEGPTAKYLVKWKGFPESEATWEPLSNLTNCAQALRDFKRNYNKKRKNAEETQPRRCVTRSQTRNNAQV